MYQAVDPAAQTIDFLITAKWDAAALHFFGKAIRHHGEPEVGSSTIRQSKYLSNLVEQELHNINRRIRQMLRFNSKLISSGTDAPDRY